MKKILIFIIAVMLIFSSCVTSKRCNQKFPPQIITTERVVIKDSIVYKPFEVPVYIKGDTVVVKSTDTIWRDKTTGLFNSKTVFAEVEFAKAWANVINSKINLKLIQKDTLFKQKTDSLNKEIYHWKEAYTNKEFTKIVKENTKFAKFALWYFWISLGVIALIVAVKLKFKVI